MKRFLFFAVLALPMAGTGPFDQRLSQDRQILQALNRLTFGPRPGDAEEVRRLGVAKWIDLQLHPERIAENPDLDIRLKPLETLRLDLPDIVKKYTPQQQEPVMMLGMAMRDNPLPQEQMRKIQMGTAEQRKALLAALDDDKRKQVLLRIPPQNLEDLPEYKKEAEDARKAQQEEVQKEMRRRNPTLQDLLDDDQIKIARSGNKEQLSALFAGLDADKRRWWPASFPRKPLPPSRNCAAKGIFTARRGRWPARISRKPRFSAPCIPIGNWKK